jgi:N-acetylglutamate synthase-like GNAT family acetyltransferase
VICGTTTLKRLVFDYFHSFAAVGSIPTSCSSLFEVMLNIRKARLKDSQGIADVHVAAVSGIRTTLYSPEEIQAWAVPKNPERYEEIIRAKEFLIAEEGGIILGFGVLDRERAEIEALYVSPQVGRRGIGLELLRKLEERACDLGLKTLRLNASLNAVPFYEKAGFVGHERSKYLLSTGVEIACVPMSKETGRADVN